MKNISIGSERSCKLQLIEKIEQVTKRTRWKAIMFTNVKHNKEENTERYGLTSIRPKTSKRIIGFRKRPDSPYEKYQI